MKRKQVFLGGTCNGSLWRDKLTPMLTNINWFDPVVADEDWDDDAWNLEIEKRETCDYCLYVITPLVTGFFSFAEVADDSNKRPKKTVFCFLTEDAGRVFDKFQAEKSLPAVANLVANNGATVCHSLEEVADFLNHA